MTYRFYRLQAAFHSILASRIVFNLRRVAKRRGSAGSTIGLHSYLDVEMFLTPMARYYLDEGTVLDGDRVQGLMIV
jgi:hypothetical protein